MLTEPLVNAHRRDAELVCNISHRAILDDIFFLQPIPSVIQRLGWLDEVLDFNNEDILAANAFMPLGSGFVENNLAQVNHFARIRVLDSHHVIPHAYIVYRTIDMFIPLLFGEVGYFGVCQPHGKCRIVA
jgi:hypothetical protein